MTQTEYWLMVVHNDLSFLRFGVALIVGLLATSRWFR